MKSTGLWTLLLPVLACGQPNAIPPRSPPIFCLGDEFACRLEGQRLSCWGANDFGQVAPGDPPSGYLGERAIMTSVRGVSCGARRACVLSDSAISCWGQPLLGTEQTDGGVSVLSGSLGVVAVTSGEEHVCGILADGGVACWGANDFGEAPSHVNLNSPAKAISSRYRHTCAVVGEAAWCWGQGSVGQLGAGGIPVRAPPRAVGLESVEAVSAGLGHSCAKTLAGDTWCWGQNLAGELGDGTRDDQLLPTGPVAVSVREVSCGTSATCLLTNRDDMVCFGKNACGIFESDGGPGVDSTVVATGVAHVAVGDGVLCFSKKNGTWECRGRNDRGQIRVPVSACATVHGSW